MKKSTLLIYYDKTLFFLYKMGGFEFAGFLSFFLSVVKNHIPSNQPLALSEFLSGKMLNFRAEIETKNCLIFLCFKNVKKCWLNKTFLKMVIRISEQFGRVEEVGAGSSICREKSIPG